MLFAVGIVSACAIAGLYLLARIVILLGEINRRLAVIELRSRPSDQERREARVSRAGE